MNIKKVLLSGGGAVIGTGVAIFSWVWFAPCALGGCAPLDDLAAYHTEGSELLDIHGEPFALLATVNRKIVSIDSLPPHLPQAFIAIEDQRFYDHGGIDFLRTAVALYRNVRSVQVSEGGSTITQQLARNLFPEWLPYRQRNIRRKLLEARVARQIERTFDKEKILELYVNHIYLGSGAYGVEAAAQTYFAKSAADLNLVESATIAGLPQAPSQINPKESVERAQRRRDLVLDQMVDAGYITAAAAAEAKAEPVVVAEGARPSEGLVAAYFVERVRQEMEERVGARFYTAGLKIHTTYDPAAQQPAEEELARQLRAIEGGSFGVYRHPRYGAAGDESGSKYLQGAIVVMDAASGEVRALVGGRDFNDSKFDRATQAVRQAGSAFKPFVYAAALERFRSPVHIVEDSPVRLTMSGGQVWEPRNYTGDYDGSITMREAITRSKNAATVHLAQEIGIRSAIDIAHSLGITTDIPEVPSAALGAADVRPIEMVAAYAAFANGGRRIEPHLLTRIEARNGHALWRASPRSTQVLDPAVAFVMTTMLQDVVDRGTGSAVRSVGFRGAAAGKTGTTNDASDVWFIGYTPDLVAGVWIGLDEPKTIVRGASGGTLAAPVWGRMMRRIYSGRPTPEAWRPPTGVVTAEVDRMTGAGVSEWCPPTGPTYVEYFIRSSPPQRYCPRYEYDRMYTYGDSAWIDEEWSDLDPYGAITEDSLVPAGVDWPELEALRRRIQQAQDDLARRRMEEAGQYGDDAADRDGQIPLGASVEPQPGQIPRTDPLPQPPEAPRPEDDSQQSRPAPEEPPREPPRLLGVPAQP